MARRLLLHNALLRNLFERNDWNINTRQSFNKQGYFLKESLPKENWFITNFLTLSQQISYQIGKFLEWPFWKSVDKFLWKK